MRVKFTKEWRGPYGVFVQGRECELSGPMLAAAPKDTYVAVTAEETKKEGSPASEQQVEPVDKQQDTPVDKQMGTPADKQVETAEKGTESDGKNKKTKKAEQSKKADS